MAERVFVDKMTRVGLADVEVLERHSFGLADAARYPLFTRDLVELMDDLLGEAQRHQVAVAVTVVARKPA